MKSVASETWVIIPAYNEEKYLGRVLAKLQKYTAKIIVVDDGSTDKTTVVATECATHVLTHRLNLGKGAALKTGCEFAFSVLGAKAVILIDADDQHDPAELPAFIAALATGQTLVLGVRTFGSEVPWLKRVGNTLASVLVKFLFGTYIPDIPSGYKAFTKSVYEQLRWQTTDYAVELEMSIKTAELKLPFTVVPIKTIYHDFDKGMTMLDTLALLKQILAYRMHL